MDPRIDSRRQELGNMGPPPAVALPSSHKADAPPLPASSAAASPSSSSLNARTATPPRRIIKTVNLDFKKLKEAGLDRKLAEVLSKQNAGARAGISHSPSSSGSSSVAMSATATATAAATPAAAAASSLHSQQQQQLHQPVLPQTAVKRTKISESIEKTVPIQTSTSPMASSNPERSLHVKAMLKNRILNKGSNTSTQQPRPMAPPKTPPAAAAEAYSIPKADLSGRQKHHPPLLLNLVNQLPKHRAMCITTENLLRNQQEQLQQKAFQRLPPPQQKPPHNRPQSPQISLQQSAQDPPQNQPHSSQISMQKSLHESQHIPPEVSSHLAAANQLVASSPEVCIIVQKSPSPPPLIVLENKVLAPNEKIDLSDLRLPSTTTTNVDTILTTKTQPQPAKSIIKGKVIMNASKFKVPREKLAEMAKEIRNQAEQVKLSSQQEAVPPAKDSTATINAHIPAILDPKQHLGYSPSTVEAIKLPSLKGKELQNSTPPPVFVEPMSVNNPTDNINNDTAATSDQGELPPEEQAIESSFIESSSPAPEPEQLPKAVMSTETSFLDFPILISSSSDPKQLNISTDPKPEKVPAAVKPDNTSTSSEKILESVETAEPKEESSTVPKVQSAVDFIAQLTAEHPLDESSFMDLSPEEQRLNAMFGGGAGCSFTGLSPEKSEKDKEKETPEDGGSFNLTAPSSQKPPEQEELPIGKILKMDDVNILHATLDVKSDSTNILRISPNAIKLRSSVVALELPEITTTEVVVASNPESLVVATPSSSQEGEHTPKAESSIDPAAEEASKESSENKLKQVTDPEPAKEANPPAKRVPLRSKKAKINLVQRNKRPSIPNKPIEAKKTKIDDDEETTATIIDHNLLEEHRLGAGVNVIQVPADEEEGVRETEEDEQQQEVRESTEYKEQEVRESIEPEPKLSSSPAKDTTSNTEADNQNSTKSAIERDLTQLYHPPKMPKTRASKKNSNHEALEQSQPLGAGAASISLMDILSQEQPPPQGDAKLPFRKESPTEVSPSKSTGIQNLITHLTAEKVSSQTKKKLSPTLPASEETSKALPRKKLVKTRPVLSKRTTKRQEEMVSNSLEFLHPINANAGGGRIPTSSTSDDDGVMFLGFNDKQEKRSRTPVRSKRVRQLKINETDISDDASPDYDETEEEKQQEAKNSDFPNKHAYDSDSSGSPIHFEENPCNEDTNCETTLVSTEAGGTWEDLKGENKESTLDATIVSENQQQEDLNENEQSETVIDVRDASIDDKKSKKNRKKSTKPSPKKATDTPAKEMNSEDPSTSKEASKTSKTMKKLQSKAVSPQASTSRETVKGFEDSENSSLAPTTEANEDTSKPLETLKENQKEVQALEKPVISVKSKGKRSSCCITPTVHLNLANQAEATLKTATYSVNADSEQKEEESKIPEEPQEPAPTEEKRQTRNSSVKGKEEQPIESDTSAKSKGKRASSRKSKADSLAPAVTEPVETSSSIGALEESIEVVPTRANRKSRSGTPKLTLPTVAQAQPIIKSKENNADRDSQMEKKEVQAAEEPTHSGRSKRQSRSKKSNVNPSIAKDDIKLNEKTKNKDSEEVQAAEEPDHSSSPPMQTKPKRQSRSKTPKALDSAVSKLEKVEKRKKNQPESQEKNQASEEPNPGSSFEVSKPVTEKEEEPLSSVKTKRKRQSRNMPQTASTIDPAEDKASIALLAESQPESHADTAGTRGKRRTSSRLSSVPADTKAETAPQDEVILDSNPKRGSRSSAARRSKDVSEVPLKEDEPEDTAPSTSNRGKGKTRLAPEVPCKKDKLEDAAPSTSNRGKGRKRPAPSDTQPSEGAKKPKTEIKQEPSMAQGFNLRLLLIRQREQLDSEEVLTSEGKGQGPLQCGLCLARSTEKDWQSHLGEHYGVGWFVGETPNLTRSWVFKMMKKYIDESGEKLICRLCQRQLGTSTGMALHLESCGNKQRVECDLCKRSYAKLSLGIHRQSCLSQQKRKEELVSSFNLRLLLIRKREQLDTEEVLTEEGKGKGPLQCGLCLARSNKQKWQTHLEEHYGVGWLVGEAPKIITRHSIMVMMKAFMDSNSKKLACRLCERQLGSALGMMLHLETCGNKQRVECELCQRSYSLLTLPSHMRMCTKRLQVADTSGVKADQEGEDEASETVYSNAGRAKRKSTIKAETQLKKIGEDIASHGPGETTIKHEFDGSDSSDYDMTKDKESSEEYDSDGVESDEDSISGEQDGSDCETSRRNKKKTFKKRPVNLGEHAAKPLFLRDETQGTRPMNKWKEFLKINYSRSTLYSEFLPSYSKLSPEDANGMLPSKETTSVRYAYGKVSEDSDWKRLAPLEGFNKKGEYIGYLGGSIKQLAWIPLPSKITDQYLLCSLRPKLKAFARHSKYKQEDALLMLLKCTQGSSPEEPWSELELHYGIRVPNGPVHSFAFLPSGGYDQASNRLGLLAVANTRSDVHIYSLPLELRDEEKCGENVVIQLDALITLSLEVDQPTVEDQCTKICWSEASGHNFLATGYASGRIAFWDIGDKESINCFKRNSDQVYTFVPLNAFYLGERNIQFMELHYDINGTRWLAVGTLVRRFMVYDILNWSQPTLLMQNTLNNLYLATFTWSPVSETIVLSSRPDSNSRTILLNPAGVEFDHRTLDSTLTACRSMDTNCQQNHMVLVTDIGDLAFLDAKDITRGVYLTKTMIKYRAVSTAKLFHLGDEKAIPKELIGADEFHRDYGVQINPLVGAPPQSSRNCPYLSDKRRPSNSHSLALTRNNCVRCNRNSSAHTWVAVGAEHGLLRILNFKRNKFF